MPDLTPAEQRTANLLADHEWQTGRYARCSCGWQATTTYWTEGRAAHRVHVARVLAADHAATLDRVRALTGGPTSDGYQPYAVQIGDDVHLAVLLDDLRAVLDGDTDPQG